MGRQPARASQVKARQAIKNTAPKGAAKVSRTEVGGESKSVGSLSGQVARSDGIGLATGTTSREVGLHISNIY